ADHEGRECSGELCQRLHRRLRAEVGELRRVLSFEAELSRRRGYGRDLAQERHHERPQAVRGGLLQSTAKRRAVGIEAGLGHAELPYTIGGRHTATAPGLCGRDSNGRWAALRGC